MPSFEAMFITLTIESVRTLRYQGGLVRARLYNENLAAAAGAVIAVGAEPNPLPVGVQRAMAYAGEL